ncbi:MAG: hypothetical protein ABI315_01950 [Bacteroidia bacterium]
MKVTFITDSYGNLRIHNNIEEVDKQSTYPELVKKQLLSLGYIVHVDAAGYRKVTDLPFLYEKYNDSDVYVIQLGIVDAYPRILSLKNTLSKSLIAKGLRKIIRKNRPFFINYIHNKPWTSEVVFRKAINNICSISQSTLIWINIAPVNEFQEKETPGANKSIIKYNEILSNEIKKYGHCTLLNIFDLFMQNEDYEKYMHPIDSHLNVLGNKMYANELLKIIDQKK